MASDKFCLVWLTVLVELGLTARSPKAPQAGTVYSRSLKTGDSSSNESASYYEDYSELMGQVTVVTMSCLALSLLGLLAYFCHMRRKTRRLSKAVAKKVIVVDFNDESKQLPIVSEVSSPEKVHVSKVLPTEAGLLDGTTPVETPDKLSLVTASPEKQLLVREDR